jgi:threonine/homoserine/homoserine lactone efflux protein
MLDIQTFFKAFVITFTMLMAVGPICLTVINVTVTYGFLAGLAAGFGVAFADSVYIVVAGLAIDMIGDLLQSKYINLFAVGGGLFLIYLSYKFWIHDIAKDKFKDLQTKSHLKQFLMLFFMTISGPTTVLTYAAVFANFIDNKYNINYVIFGGICGTFSFYLVLVSLLCLFRKRMNMSFMKCINKLSAVAIFIFSILIIRNGVSGLLVN